MRKRTVVIILLAALLLLAICIGIYLAYNYQMSKNVPTDVFSCISSQIEGYKVTDQGASYSLEKEDGVWYLEGDQSAQLDQDAVSKMIAAASKITASKRLSRKELSSFDMSDITTVKIDVDDGEDVVIRFLGTSNNMCAFRVSGDRRAYAMYAQTKDILAPSIESLRITSVFLELSKTETLPQYYRYTDYDGETTEIRLKTNSEFVKGKNNRYMMVKPYLREVDDDSFEQQIAVKIPLLKAKSFVEKPSNDKSEYGLDEKSRAELEFVWDDQRETLYLGKEEGGIVFAMKKSDESIFLIDALSLEFLQVEPFFILDSGILKSDSERIMGVKIEVKDMVYNITSSKNGENSRQYFINGKAISSYVFDEILEKLSDISFKNEIYKAPQNTKDIKITVSYENVSTQEISLVKTSEKACAVFLNGNAEFEVDKEDVDDFIEELKEALNNPQRIK